MQAFLDVRAVVSGVFLFYPFKATQAACMRDEVASFLGDAVGGDTV